MKNINLSKGEIIFLLISFFIIFIYFYQSFQETKNTIERNKNYASFICLRQICIDDGVYNKCITFPNSESFSLKILHNITKDGNIIELKKLGKTCK